MSVLELAPIALVVQLVLDRFVPYLGSALVLVGNLALIRALRDDGSFPLARIVRRR